MSKGDILWFSDSPMAPTGIGTVAKGLMKNLMQDWDITCFAANHTDTSKKINKFWDEGVKFIPSTTKQDFYGREKLIDLIKTETVEPDIIFLYNDHFVLSKTIEIDMAGERKKGRFIDILRRYADEIGAKIVTYFPVDCRPYLGDVAPVVENSHRPVTFTGWAADITDDVLQNSLKSESKHEDLVGKTEYVYHGTDRSDWHKLTEMENENFFELMEGDLVQPDNYIVSYVGGHNVRKQIPRDVFEPFARFASDHEDAVLLIKCPQKQKDYWHLPKLANRICHENGANPEQIVFMQHGNEYVAQEMIRHLYNISDLLYLPSQEGWGLPVTEAMACGTLTMVGDHAALSEVGGQGRSIKVDVPDNANNRIYPIGSKSMRRTVVDINDAVEKFEKAYNMDEKTREEYINKSYSFVKKHSFERKAERFDQIFTEEKVNEQ